MQQRRYDAGLSRAQLSRNQLLECDDDLRSNEHGVFSAVGTRAMGADAGHDDVHAVDTRVRRTLGDVELSSFDVGSHMKGEGVVRLAKALPQPILVHRLSARDLPLFRRLADEHQRTGPGIELGGHPSRRPHERGNVHVVPASMHHGKFLSVVIDLRDGRGVLSRPSAAEADSYDNALAESIIGLYKTEVTRRRGPWRGPEDVEFATLEGNPGRFTFPVKCPPGSPSSVRLHQGTEAPYPME